MSKNQEPANGPSRGMQDPAHGNASLRPLSQQADTLHQPSSKSVRLSREEAGRWLEIVGGWTSASDNRTAELEALRNALEDACWLARWKREDVLLELRSSILAAVVEELLRIAQTDPVTPVLPLLEDMIKHLSRD